MSLANSEIQGSIAKQVQPMVNLTKELREIINSQNDETALKSINALFAEFNNNFWEHDLIMLVLDRNQPTVLRKLLENCKGGFYNTTRYLSVALKTFRFACLDVLFTHFKWSQRDLIYIRTTDWENQAIQNANNIKDATERENAFKFVHLISSKLNSSSSEEATLSLHAQLAGDSEGNWNYFMYLLIQHQEALTEYLYGSIISRAEVLAKQNKYDKFKQLLSYLASRINPEMRFVDRFKRQLLLTFTYFKDITEDDILSCINDSPLNKSPHDILFDDPQHLFESALRNGGHSLMAFLVSSRKHQPDVSLTTLRDASTANQFKCVLFAVKTLGTKLDYNDVAVLKRELIRPKSGSPLLEDFSALEAELTRLQIQLAGTPTSKPKSSQPQSTPDARPNSSEANPYFFLKPSPSAVPASPIISAGGTKSPVTEDNPFKAYLKDLDLSLVKFIGSRLQSQTPQNSVKNAGLDLATFQTALNELEFQALTSCLSKRLMSMPVMLHGLRFDLSELLAIPVDQQQKQRINPKADGYAFDLRAIQPDLGFQPTLEKAIEKQKRRLERRPQM